MRIALPGVGNGNGGVGQIEVEGSCMAELCHQRGHGYQQVRVAGPGVTRGRRGRWRTEEGERAISVTAMRRRLCVMDVKCQASSILWRLETKGPGSTAALARRQQGRKLERMWQRYMRAQAAREGWRAVRSGFGRVD